MRNIKEQVGKVSTQRETYQTLYKYRTAGDVRLNSPDASRQCDGSETLINRFFISLSPK